MHKIIPYPGENGHRVAGCPSLPGCISQGKTKATARANIRIGIAGYEAALEVIEDDPKFIEMMKRSAEDIRAGRVTSQEEVERRLRERKKEF
jgi:predicted RNase H-like HicB family nuclease